MIWNPFIPDLDVLLWEATIAVTMVLSIANFMLLIMLLKIFRERRPDPE